MFLIKPEYKELMLPFVYIDDPNDIEAGIIAIEAYGSILGKEKYCYAGYTLKNRRMYDSDDYKQMVALLKNSADKKIRIILKIKKGIPKDFKIDIDSIAKAYNDDRFKLLELAIWGFNDKRFKELNFDGYQEQ